MAMGCVKLMNSLTALTEPYKKDPEKILSALRDHFMPQKHLLFERVKFGFANDAENESTDQYIVRLHQLAESCEFENLCESLLRDRLVIGTRDKYTRDRQLRAERPVPRLARCMEALCVSELSRIHKEHILSVQTLFMQQESIIQQRRKGKKMVVVTMQTQEVVTSPEKKKQVLWHQTSV